MTRDHGPSVKDDEQYEGLRKQGMSDSRAAVIANSPDSSGHGGTTSGSSRRAKSSGSGEPAVTASILALAAGWLLGRRSGR